MTGSGSTNMQEDAISALEEAKEQTFQGSVCKMNTRHARWTREETVMLIQAKLAIENRVRARNRSSSVFASDQNEPKWGLVSSYCKQHGVNREAVQCQKRWSNLLGDFKKIKTWESQITKEAESFWKLRSDFRRERKLPSLFDKEIYDILDGRRCTMAASPLAQITALAEIDNGVDHQTAAAAEEDEVNEEAADEIRQGNEKETTPTRSPGKMVNAGSPFSGEIKEKCPYSVARTGIEMQGRLKRRRLSMDRSRDINLAKVLEKNSNMINSQLEVQNINYQLDRDQRKEQADNLVTALNKLADALVKIANKL